MAQNEVAGGPGEDRVNDRPDDDERSTDADVDAGQSSGTDQRSDASAAAAPDLVADGTSVVEPAELDPTAEVIEDGLSPTADSAPLDEEPSDAAAEETDVVDGFAALELDLELESESGEAASEDSALMPGEVTLNEEPELGEEPASEELHSESEESTSRSAEESDSAPAAGEATAATSESVTSEIVPEVPIEDAEGEADADGTASDLDVVIEDASPVDEEDVAFDASFSGGVMEDAGSAHDVGSAEPDQSDHAVGSDPVTDEMHPSGGDDQTDTSTNESSDHEEHPFVLLVKDEPVGDGHEAPSADSGADAPSAESAVEISAADASEEDSGSTGRGALDGPFDGATEAAADDVDEALAGLEPDDEIAVTAGTPDGEPDASREVDGEDEEPEPAFVGVTIEQLASSGDAAEPRDDEEQDQDDHDETAEETAEPAPVAAPDDAASGDEGRPDEDRLDEIEAVSEPSDADQDASGQVDDEPEQVEQPDTAFAEVSVENTAGASTAAAPRDEHGDAAARREADAAAENEAPRGSDDHPDIDAQDEEPLSEDGPLRSGGPETSDADAAVTVDDPEIDDPDLDDFPRIADDRIEDEPAFVGVTLEDLAAHGAAAQPHDDAEPEPEPEPHEDEEDDDEQAVDAEAERAVIAVDQDDREPSSENGEAAEPAVARAWTTAEELFSGAVPIVRPAAEPSADAGDVARTTTESVGPQSDVPAEGVSAEATPQPVVPPVAAAAIAVPKPPRSTGGSGGGSRPPRRPRPVRERFGREAVGIAVLVVLALICGGLITAVVLKTQRDAAVAAAEAANYTPPPLATPVPTSTGPVVAIIGDGVTTSAATGVTTSQRWPALLGASLGGSVDADASSGMGYAAKGKSGQTFVQAAAKIPADAEAVVIFGGAADANVSALSVAKAATDAFSAAAEQAPDAKLIVVGPALADGASDADLSMIRNSLRSAAAIASATWIDPIDKDWLSPERQAGEPSGLSTSDEKTLASKMASAVKTALK